MYRVYDYEGELVYKVEDREEALTLAHQEGGGIQWRDEPNEESK